MSPTTNYSQSPSKTDSSLKGDPASIIGHNGSETTSRNSTSRDEVTAMVKTVVVSKLGEDAHTIACPISPLDPSKTNGIIEVPHHSEVIVTHPASPVPVLASDIFGLRAIFVDTFVDNRGIFPFLSTTTMHILVYNENSS